MSAAIGHHTPAYGVTDFLAALALGDTEPLGGMPAESPWDPELARALASASRSIMEERLIPALLSDLLLAASAL